MHLGRRMSELETTPQHREVLAISRAISSLHTTKQKKKKSLLLVFALIPSTAPSAAGSLGADPQKGFLRTLGGELAARERPAVIPGDTTTLSRRLGPRQLEAILNADFTLPVSCLLIFHE